ncbi:MAG: RES family NAD+ phosphorylase [Pseudomonadota bacterium]
MSSGGPPPAGLASRSLRLVEPPAGINWRRLYLSKYPDPLGMGPGHSRFSDPTGAAFTLVYLGSSAKVAFIEAILRDRADGRDEDFTIPLAEIEAFNCAEISIREPLRLVDLTGDGPIRLGVPSDVLGARDQTLGQIWSEAFYNHSDQADGILYPSRLNEERNIAIYDRAVSKLTPRRTRRLIENRDELAQIIVDLELAIV